MISYESTNKIDELVKKLRNLEEGTYTKDYLKINVINQKGNKDYSDCFNININKNSFNIDIHIPFIDEYSINIENKLYDYYIFISKTFYHNPYISLNLKENGNEYNIRNNYIYINNKDISYSIKNNELVRKIDEHCKISYNYNDNQIYVYFKKYDKAENEDNNYIRFKYDDKFIKNRSIYNKQINKIKDNLKNEVYNKEFKELINTINIPLLKEDLCDEVKSLLEVSKIYKDNISKLNFDETDLFNEISEFTEHLINNPTEAKINSLKTIINDLDLTDKKVIKTIKNKLNEIYISNELDKINNGLEAKKLYLMMTDIKK